ncbi:MAG: ornithine carbamoyltransferase [Phycisphaerales bacterium]|nr:ornithine carbamoyltransferase [Phycisphaerales bacterium]
MTTRTGCRHFVSVKDFTADEIIDVIDLADTLKQERVAGAEPPRLAGKTLGMIFQKPSLRTRVSFETGMTQLGGHAIYLAPADISLGQRETTEDIALVLSRYCDLIMARVFGHDIVTEMARHATVPVINGLSDREHPCQILADLQTIRERRGGLAGVRCVYSGDGNNVAHSLMYGAALTGMHLAVVTPPGFEPDGDILADARQLGETRDARITATTDLAAASRDADVIYTDVWASMGQEEEAEARKAKFAAYQVNETLLANAAADVTVLHCLPAHYGEEITYTASRVPGSAIFDQAENRLHAQKALMVRLG